MNAEWLTTWVNYGVLPKNNWELASVKVSL